MFKRLMCILFVIGLAASAQADTLAYWTFDGGTVGEPLLSDTDTAFGFMVEAFTDTDGSGGGSLTYGAGVMGTCADLYNPDPDNSKGMALFHNDDPLLKLMLPQFTIEGFINVRTDRQSVCLVRKYGGDGRYFVDIRGDGAVYFAINSDDNVVGSAGGTIQTGVWQHVAAVFDQDAAEPMKLYVDKNLVASGGLSTPPLNSDRSFGIGCIIRDNSYPPGNSGQFFDGLIDEVRISDAALTPDQFLPEPATIMLLGLGGLALIRRKR